MAVVNKVRIAVLVSGGGSNLQAIVDSIELGKISDCEIGVVVSNRPEAYALTRARQHQIESLVLPRKNFPGEIDYGVRLIDELTQREINLVCLAGFLLKVPVNLVHHYPQRIMNIHPALLPAFGGSGMYGRHVHQAVLTSGAKYTGCTVHFVDEIYDNGPIILQTVVPVYDDDTVDSLAQRVLEQEHRLYPIAIKLYVEGKLRVVGKRVNIIP